jgi:AraC-like DNA-binding protein
MSIRQLNLEDGYGILVKSNYQTKSHRHYAIEAVYCRDGFFDIETKETKYTGIKSVLIPSWLPHSFRCYEAACELLFVDPLSRVGKIITEIYAPEEKQDVIVHPRQIELFFDGRYLRESINAKTNGVDARIHECIEAIESNTEALTVKQLSKIACLSESRLAHLFKEEAGISVHQYILWKKMCLAVSQVSVGESLTSSAHFAGFADSAHFHKVFSNMFGVNPFLGLKV